MDVNRSSSKMSISISHLARMFLPQQEVAGWTCISKTGPILRNICRAAGSRNTCIRSSSPTKTRASSRIWQSTSSYSSIVKTPPGALRPDSALYNELDVVFTDGYSLYIVECKAGDVTQEQVMKLQNLVEDFMAGWKVEASLLRASRPAPRQCGRRSRTQDYRFAVENGSRNSSMP